MNKLLYFTCPTDQLEPVINNEIEYENYYFNSLGNSATFDSDLLIHLKKLITSKSINKIYFVLSTDNRIVLDALGNQKYSSITGLNQFYYHIKMHQENAKDLWQERYSQLLVFSYHLNSKITELKQGLQDLLSVELDINGKIYDIRKKDFIRIHSELFCLKYANFN